MSWLRITAWLEGISFLVLLGVAMPMKYAAGKPEWVLVVGWIHGALFMLLVILLTLVMNRQDWPLKRVGFVILAALLPFGPFVFDRRIRRYEEEGAAARAAISSNPAGGSTPRS